MSLFSQKLARRMCSLGARLSASPYFQNETKKHKACQIDLLLQCRYSIYVCEIKCRSKITSDVIAEVTEKITRLPIQKGVSIRPVLIYQGELTTEIKQANFFTNLISFEELLCIG